MHISSISDDCRVSVEHQMQLAFSDIFCISFCCICIRLNPSSPCQRVDKFEARRTQLPSTPANDNPSFSNFIVNPSLKKRNNGRVGELNRERENHIKQNNTKSVQSFPRKKKQPEKQRHTQREEKINFLFNFLLTRSYTAQCVNNFVVARAVMKEEKHE
jgi:hypothetical protein